MTQSEARAELEDRLGCELTDELWLRAQTVRIAHGSVFFRVADDGAVTIIPPHEIILFSVDGEPITTPGEDMLPQ